MSRKPITIAWSCGVVPGCEHATEEEAWEHIKEKGVLSGTVKLDTTEFALLLDLFRRQQPTGIPAHPGRPVIFKSVEFVEEGLDESQTELIYTIRFTAVFEHNEPAAAKVAP